jgi:hypothetical protein
MTLMDDVAKVTEIFFEITPPEDRHLLFLALKLINEEWDKAVVEMYDYKESKNEQQPIHFSTTKDMASALIPVIMPVWVKPDPNYKITLKKSEGALAY